MWKPALLGALALAVAGTSLATTAAGADEPGYVRHESGYYTQQHLQAGAFISNAQIRRFKAALRLTVEQERHWPAVAAALRNMRLGPHAAAAATDPSSLLRLVSVAKPLFDSLDDDQKRTALQLVQSLGFGAFVASL